MDSGKPLAISDHLGREIVGMRERERKLGENGGVFLALERVFY